MDRRQLGIIFLFAAAGVSPAFASQKTAAPASRGCLECHSQVSLQGTVHAALSCADCHAGLITREGTPPHQAKKDLPPPACGTSCHRAPPDSRPGGGPSSYPDSVHGRAYLERHEPEVARCWDCHGHHVIKPAADPDSLVNRRNIPMTCSRCHEDMAVVVKYNIHAESPYREYSRSVHGRPPSAGGGPEFAAVCTDCHGVHNIQGAGTPRLPAKEPATCGKCHSHVLDAYAKSIHGREALKGNPDVPLCVDCHGEHAVAPAASPASPTARARVPDTCSTCHARPEIMRKYGVPEDRIATFIDSFHGIAIGMGGTAEASCVDCHGVHDIRPASDPESAVFPANLPKTCGQASCHPAMTAKIAGTRIHRSYDRPSSGAPYYVRKALLWAVFILTALSLLYLLPSLIRRVGGRRNP
ncbi:MAG: hypothetical protein ACXW2O_03125 [Candidatus Aminicenantales bacterium]